MGSSLPSSRWLTHKDMLSEKDRRFRFYLEGEGQSMLHEA